VRRSRADERGDAASRSARSPRGAAAVARSAAAAAAAVARGHGRRRARERRRAIRRVARSRALAALSAATASCPNTASKIDSTRASIPLWTSSTDLSSASTADMTSIKSLLLSLDLFIYMIFIGFIVTLITLITRIDLLTRIVARHPGISLLTFFVLLFKSFYLISGYHYSSITIDMCRLNIAQHFIFLTPPNTFNLKTGLSLLLVPLFGNLVYKLQATHYLYTLGLFLGIVTKTHLPFHNNSLAFIIYGLFVVMMILNIYLAKTPLHAFDAPFLKTQRCPLKPSRWLKKLSYAFSTILCMQVICPPIYTFILLQNFGLLILIGICYCSFIKLIEYFFVYLRSFFNILQLKRANALSS
jgi:hypothetical protein